MSEFDKTKNSETDEIDLLDLYFVLKKRKKLIAYIVIGISVLAVIVSLLMTKIYRATAVIMPLQQKSGLMSSIGDLGGLASLAGIGSSGATPEAKLMAILQSRTLAENVIDKTGLMQVFYKDAWDSEKNKWKNESPDEQPKMEDAVKLFKNSYVTYEQNKELSIISINADFKDPVLSAKVANAVTEELQNIINQKAFSVSKKNRLFIEEQLRQNKKDFLEAGKALADFYRRNPVSGIESKIDVSIDLERDDVATEDIEFQINDLSKQRMEIEKKLEASKVKDVPQQVYLAYLEMRREVIAKINGLLSTQYEMAQIDETKEDLSFQIVDDAVTPIMRYKPKRKLICVVSFMAGIFLAVFIAFMLEYFEKMKAEIRRREH